MNGQGSVWQQAQLGAAGSASRAALARRRNEVANEVANEVPREPASFEEIGRKPLKKGGRSPSEIVLLDADGVIIAANEAWRASVSAFKIAAPPSCIGISYVEMARRFLPDLDAEGLWKSLQQLFSGELDQVRHTFVVDVDGRPLWRQVEITPFLFGDSSQFMAIHEDLTELMHAQDALRQVSHQLMKVQDEERQRIAIELHDSTSQHLAAIGLGLMRLRGLSRKPAAAELLKDMAGSLAEAVRETRVLSYLMKPTNLLRERLERTTRRFVEGLGARTGLEVEFEARGDVDDADTAVQHAAFRVVQEALANCCRHSGAQRISVVLSSQDGQLTVEVADDGGGFLTPQATTEGASLGVGIPGMEARVEQLQGHFQLLSSKDGTRVVAVLPMHIAEEDVAGPERAAHERAVRYG